MGAVCGLAAHFAAASQADDAVITIVAQNPGPVPFISQLTLSANDTSFLKSIQFTIAPKPGSVTLPLSGTYSNDYLIDRGFEESSEPQIFLPVYGLYDGYNNTITLTYRFLDGSSKLANTTITTPVFDDPCGYKDPTILQARTNSTGLSYDYIMVKGGSCSIYSPAIIDTDGALRWVGTAHQETGTGTFFDNAAYIAAGPRLYRIELDGAFTLLREYSDIGVTDFNHNIDRGKAGIILDADTASYFESTFIEVDASGAVLKQWNMADIISAAMIAGGDDPSQFVYPAPSDWFHLNGVAYNRADDSLVVSSREDFLICIDYESGAIKWILGDETKKWFQFPSLAQYALALAPGSLPPIGQHAPSITYDQDVLIFDNGEQSIFQAPPGEHRGYASPRKYHLDLNAKVATEVWNFEMDQSIVCPFCGSIYEDAPLKYVIDYAFVPAGVGNYVAQLLGLDAADETVFYYQYDTATGCSTAYNSSPLHLENIHFPTVGPQALNLSTRGEIASGDDVLIGGFIVTGTASKEVVLRALGPSLASSGLSGALADPVLTLYDASGAIIATNDDWNDDAGAQELTARQLAPTDSAEAATVQYLSPGAYTVVVMGKDSAAGIGLVEAYDLSPSASSKLANMSTRGLVGTGDDALIAGFIVGDVANATVAVRALGPSLASHNISEPLANPSLAIYDRNGITLATNDNWQDDSNQIDLQQNGLAPTDPTEAATILYLPAGAYSAIVSGADGGTGVGLVEVYDLDPARTASAVR